MDIQTRKELRSSGECSNLTVQVGTEKFLLHKFPMIGCSDYFRSLVKSRMSDSSSVELNEFPGGETTMELIADFCYELPISLTLENICHVMCASDYLQIKTLTSKCKTKLEQLLKESLSNCFTVLLCCIDVKLRAEAAGVTAMCTKVLVEYLQQTIEGKHPGTMIWQANLRQEGATQRLGFGGSGSQPQVVLEASTIVAIMSRLPIKWNTCVIESLSATHRKWDELPTKLSDQLLNHAASNFCISGEEFVLLLEASSLAPRKSYDSVFEALEKLMVAEQERQTSTPTDKQVESTSVVSQSCEGLSDQDIWKIVDYIDFSKLSEDALERAGENKHIPHDLWKKKVLSLLQSYKYALTIERLSGRWSDEGQNNFLDVSCLSVGSGRSELQVSKRSKPGTWSNTTREPIKEQEVYISVLARQDSHPGCIEKPAANEMKFPPVTGRPRLLVSSAGDELFYNPPDNAMRDFIRWRKHTD